MFPGVKFRAAFPFARLRVDFTPLYDFGVTRDSEGNSLRRERVLG